MSGALGRLKPSDFDHVASARVIDLATPPTDRPVTIGIEWWTSFDSPVRAGDGSYHLPDAKQNLGSVRGSHCVTLAPMGYFKTPWVLLERFWRWYDQVSEGACEGAGHARAQTILRGATFDLFWLYDQARRREGTYPNGEGSTNKAVCEVLEQVGIRESTAAVAEREVDDKPVEPAISSFAWCTTAEEVCNALGRPNASAVPLLNSWGSSYPLVTWLPVDTLDRLLHEEGEADVVVDR